MSSGCQDHNLTFLQAQCLQIRQGSCVNCVRGDGANIICNTETMNKVVHQNLSARKIGSINRSGRQISFNP